MTFGKDFDPDSEYIGGTEPIPLETAVKQEYINLFKEERNALWKRLVWLNMNVFLLTKLEQFPFEVFFLSYEMNFWNVTVAGLQYSSVMIACSIWCDEDSRVLTITGFANEIRDKYINDSYREEFIRRISCYQDFETIECTQKKLIKLRNNVYAHFNRDWHIAYSDSEIEQRRIQLRDLQQTCRFVNRMFDAICFDAFFSKLPLSYQLSSSQSGDTSREADVDSIFKSLLRGNHVLNMPEQQKEFWPYYRANLDEKKISLFNEYRRWLGLSEA